jgi:hypothetical protein
LFDRVGREELASRKGKLFDRADIALVQTPPELTPDTGCKHLREQVGKVRPLVLPHLNPRTLRKFVPGVEEQKI